VIDVATDNEAMPNEVSHVPDLAGTLLGVPDVDEDLSESRGP
jgi:hypothetical protein